MPNQATTEEIEAFLAEVREAISRGRCSLVPRDKNMASLARLGLTVSDALDEVKSLTVSDYLKGPESDHNPAAPDPVWVFGKNVDGQTFYIKAKVLQAQPGSARVISFHIAEYKIL